MNGKRVVAVAGSFDPLQAGHVQLMREAKRMGDELVLILKNDDWLLAKKGFVMIPEQERKEIMESVRYVDRVIYSLHPTNPEDMSICTELRLLHPDVFVNGGGRSEIEEEYLLCRKLGIEVVLDIGGVTMDFLEKEKRKEAGSAPS